MYGALERGLSFKLTMGNIITLCPPLTVTYEEMDRCDINKIYINVYNSACLEEMAASGLSLKFLMLFVPSLSWQVVVFDSNLETQKTKRCVFFAQGLRCARGVHRGGGGKDEGRVRYARSASSASLPRGAQQAQSVGQDAGSGGGRAELL